MYYIESEKIIQLHKELSEYFPTLNFSIPNLSEDFHIDSIEDFEKLNLPMISTEKKNKSNLL